MKNMIALLATILLISTIMTDDRVKVDLYFESLCPYCQDFILGSFKTAMNTQGFDTICNYNFYPYGNAHESGSAGNYQWSCQHGTQECVGNLIETCALKTLPKSQAYQFIVCLEDGQSKYGNFDTAASKCAQQIGFSYTQVQNCISSKDGNEAQHDIAQQTASLNPPHKWVPWIVINDVYDENAQDQLQDNMLKYVCANYKGSIKLPACANAMNESYGSDKGKRYIESSPYERVMELVNFRRY